MILAYCSITWAVGFLVSLIVYDRDELTSKGLLFTALSPALIPLIALTAFLAVFTDLTNLWRVSRRGRFLEEKRP